ncbi:MAG: DUF5681 domain-containing protein [Alphaproteobacteria bacterium]|nr:DUF5681 domain-containing protein [Alphaproteobacteria bacterium]
MSKKKQPSGRYKVGYCKPPKDTQFKKGHSGNRTGRPKGTINKPKEDSVLTIIAREAYREVPVNDGTRTLTLPLIVVSAKSLAQKAAKGDLRAANMLVSLLMVVEEKGISDQAILQKQQSEAFDKGLNSLTDEELDAFTKLLGKINSTPPSPSPTQRGPRATRARLTDLDQ